MTDTQKLKVRFRQDPRVDWIYVRFMAGWDSITVRTSSVYSPYGQILRWLEAVAIGVDECGTEFEAEGPDFHLSFCRWSLSEDDGMLKVERQYGRDYCFEAHVGRAQFVNAIYTGFVRFIESPLYCRERWEEMTIGQWCCYRVDEKFTQEQIIGQLLSMPSEKAEETLITLWPCRYESASVKATYESIAAAMNGLKPNKVAVGLENLSVLAGEGKVLAKMDPALRREHLWGLFKCKGSSWFGEPIYKLRSALVERYLASEFPMNTGGKVVPITRHRSLASRAV